MGSYSEFDWRAGVVALPVLLGLAGCWSSGPFDYVDVSGRVVYEDGSPLPAPVRVAFISQAPAVDGKYHPRPAYTFTDESGGFDSVTSQRPGDGITPGKHKVLIIFEADNPERVIPNEYTLETTTPLEVDASDSPFELRVRKP